MIRRFIWVLALFLAALAMGCQQTENFPVPPDTRIDKTVFALVPVRAAYVKPETPIADEDARKVENALRMTYAPVECTGSKARESMNIILGATRKSPDLVKRNGRKIVVIAGGVEPVTYNNCHVVGSHVVGGATLLKVFSRTAKSDEEFAFQQSLWLAIREPWRLHAGVLSGDFYTFLAEHVGAVPSEDRTQASLNVLTLDRTFNPCSTDKGSGRNKNVFFKCVGQASYANTRAFASHRDKFLSFIAKTETTYLKNLAASPSADGPEVEGMTAALRATGSPYDIKVTAASTAAISVAAPESNVADNAISAPAATNILKIDGSSLGRVLGLRALRGPDPVISASNPRVAVTPPTMFPDAASPTAGTPDQNGWQKMGNDTYFAVRGDSYVTAKAVAGVNGPVFRTGVWQVMGTNYWSGDLGHSTWQFSAARKQFWRRSFNGNPFDFAAGQMAQADTSGGTKVRTVGATTGAITVPKGWKVLADGSLKDPAGQIWVWKPALGAFVKLLNPSTGPPSSAGKSAGSSSGGSSAGSTGSSSGPQSPACGCTASTTGTSGTSGTGTGGTGTGTGGTGTGGTGTGGTGTGGTGTGGTGTGGTGTGGTGTTGGGDVTPAPTGIDAFRSDYNNAHPDGPQLQGSAADQQALISTAGNVQDYSGVARALPYGGNRVGPDGTTVGDTYSKGYTANADGTFTADGTRNICGDMSFNTQQGLNELGINSGQVAVQFTNAMGDTSYHAVNYIQTGTNEMGDATFQFYDPQTGQATGTGYTNATEGIQALGEQAGSSYGSMGDWSVSTAAGGIIGPGEAFTAPANAGGGLQDGSNSPNGNAATWLNNYQSGQTEAAKGDSAPTTQPSDQGGDKTPTAQPGGNDPGNTPTPSAQPGESSSSSSGGSDNNTPTSSSDDGNDPVDTTGSPPATEEPPPDSGDSFPEDSTSGDMGGGDYGGGDYGGGDYGGGDYSGGSDEESLTRLHLAKAK